MTHSFRKHKQHGHHHKGHMVMPGTPLPHLVIGHPAFAFRILERAFNPIPLPLHPAQPLQLCLLRGIAQGGLYIWIGPQSLRDNQTPAMGFLRLSVPHVNSHPTAQHPKHPSGGMAKRHLLPTLRREGVHKFANLNAFSVSPIFCKWAPKVADFLRHIGLRIFLINMKVRMDVYNEVKIERRGKWKKSGLTRIFRSVKG